MHGSPIAQEWPPSPDNGGAAIDPAAPTMALFVSHHKFSGAMIGLYRGHLTCNASAGVVDSLRAAQTQ